jgi:hypothetical protein
MLPDKLMKDVVWAAWEDDEIGNPTNLDSGFDLKLHCEKVQCEQGIFPKWDKSKFSRKITPAGSDDEIDYWMTNLNDLEIEYQPCTMAELSRTASMIYDLYMGRDTSRSVGVDGGKPSDEDGEVEESPRPRKPGPSRRCRRGRRGRSLLARLPSVPSRKTRKSLPARPPSVPSRKTKKSLLARLPSVAIEEDEEEPPRKTAKRAVEEEGRASSQDQRQSTTKTRLQKHLASHCTKTMKHLPTMTMPMIGSTRI